MKTFLLKPQLLLLLVLLAFSSCRQDNTQVETKTVAVAAGDPLPSWNDGQLKKDIIAYVEKVTTEGSADFIPAGDRIATFDNDGTLWAEQPAIQALFAFELAAKMIQKDPALAKKQPFKAIAEKDKSYFDKMTAKGFFDLLLQTHAGMSQEQFEAEAREFFKAFKHPSLGLTAKQLTYQPQIELLQYLRANGFTTFICTGGTREFVRTISDEYYGIPPQQVIGTSFVYTYMDSTNGLMREPKIMEITDEKGKPGGIQQQIGKRPVFACGNERSGGDIYMLRYSQGSKYLSFQLMVNHDDAAREFAYSEPNNISLDWAKKYSWHVVNMKTDWKTVFVK